MLVRDIMDSDLVTVSHSASIQEASAIMLQRGAASLCVTYEGRLLGVITDKNILYGVVAQGFSPRERRVWEFMDLNPPIASPDMSIFELIALMDQHHLARLSVVEEGTLIGIVTLAGIAAKLDLI